MLPNYQLQIIEDNNFSLGKIKNISSSNGIWKSRVKKRVKKPSYGL